MVQLLTFDAAPRPGKITLDMPLSKRQEQIVAEHVARVLEMYRPQFYALLIEQLRDRRRVSDMHVHDAASYTAYLLRR
jgi:hypothetical protein